MSSVDIVGLGAVAWDTHLVVDAYPGADTKVRARDRWTACGGLTGRALRAAAALGARCAYAGKLGCDSASESVAKAFREDGIDTDHATRDVRFGVVESVIVIASENGTRNVFSYASGETGASEESP